MDQLDAMRLLVAVVDAGSLSAAGRRLGLPLTTVSRQIAALEARLGARLLNRSTRRLSPTPSGADYLVACRRILDMVEEADRAAAREYDSPRGTVTISAPLMFGRLHVLPVLSELLAAYPEVSVRLRQEDHAVPLIEEHVDIAVRIAHLPDSGLVATRVGAVRRVVCASPDYLTARGVPERPEAIADHAGIILANMTPNGTWIFVNEQDEIAIRVPSRLTVHTSEAAVEAATAGFGLTRVLSYQVAAAVAAGGLRIVLQNFEPATWPVNLVHAGQARLPLKTRVCLDVLATRLRQRLSALDVGQDWSGVAGRRKVPRL